MARIAKPPLSAKDKVLLFSIFVMHIWGTLLVADGTPNSQQADMFGSIVYGIGILLAVYTGDKRFKDFALMKWGGKEGKETVVDANSPPQSVEKPVE